MCVGCYCNPAQRAIYMFGFWFGIVVCIAMTTPCFHLLSGMYHVGDVVSLFCHAIGCFLVSFPSAATVLRCSLMCYLRSETLPCTFLTSVCHFIK